MAGTEENETPATTNGTANGKADNSAVATAGAKGTRARSEISYPYYGLGVGIQVVEAVRRAGGNEASCADVMRELEVAKPTDRLWAYGIPAAGYFGLIERIGRGDEGRIKLTELALRIVLPGNPDEARAARAAAFRTPDLYAKLIERYAGHPVPARDGLKNVLHRDFKIVESTAGVAADAFIESLKTADLIAADNAILATEDARPPVTQDKPKDPAPPAETPPRPGMQALYVPEDFIIYKCKLGKGRVIDIPLPREFTTVEVERLYAFLKTQIDDE